MPDVLKKGRINLHTHIQNIEMSGDSSYTARERKRFYMSPTLDSRLKSSIIPIKEQNSKRVIFLPSQSL